MSKKQVAILFKYNESTYEITEYPIDFAKLKELIKKMLNTPRDRDVQLSWMRIPNSDYVNIMDDNNLKNCFDKQMMMSQDQQNPFEIIINIRVTDVPSQQNQEPFGSRAQEKELSKSISLQYHINQQKLMNQAQDMQSLNNANLQLQVEYDKSKYTDYCCYNCGGENAMQNADPKCQVCQGVGKLLKTKEIETIEYLIEKKLCQLYPELKQIYKRFESAGDDVAPTPTNVQIPASSPINFYIPPQEQASEPQSIKPQQEQQPSLNTINSTVTNPTNNNINIIKPPEESGPKPVGKPKKRKLEFDNLFSNPQNNQSPNSNANTTPNGDEQPNKLQIDRADNFQTLGASNNTTVLKSSDELFSFDVFKHPSDKSEVVFRNNEKQSINFEIKRKSKSWPFSKIYIEETPERYFENLSEKKEFDFSNNEEIQIIQLILKPLSHVQGIIVSKLKLFYLDSNNEKRPINGVIPLKAIIQNN